MSQVPGFVHRQLAALQDYIAIRNGESRVLNGNTALDGQSSAHVGGASNI